MLEIPVLRWGQPYKSLDVDEVECRVVRRIAVQVKQRQR